MKTEKYQSPDDATGQPIGIRGDVLVVDISSGANAEKYLVAEYFGVDMGKFNCEVYKTSKIALRKVPAGIYPCDSGLRSNQPTSRRLRVKTYYIGVFPITQRQYEKVMGYNPSYYSPPSEYPAFLQKCDYKSPVMRISWHEIRGGADIQAEITANSPKGFLQRLTARTGISGFDLPTEAQWEIAARSGSTEPWGEFWDGESAVKITESNLKLAAWCEKEGEFTPKIVGLKLPNLWGLYDTSGNVFEWCRDFYASPYNAAYVDSPLIASMVARVSRGGSWRAPASVCAPSYRDEYFPYYAYCDFIGFRLACATESPLPI